ncbi:MAG: anti-sigma factor [Planctomycetota bacterium]
MPPTPNNPQVSNPLVAAAARVTGDRAARLEELLCDRAVFGLDAADEAELEALVGGAIDWPSDEELASAELALAQYETEQDEADQQEPERPAGGLPARTRERLLDEAQQFDFGSAANQAVRPAVAAMPMPVVTEAPSRAKNVAWLLATAASLLIGLGLGGRLLQNDSGKSAVVTIAQQVEGLRASPGVSVVRWAPTDDVAAVGPADTGEREAFDWGEVVWSDAEQRGYMVFHGLAANDASIEQYQLWVFDEARNAEHPVDGGVFDIAGTPGEAVAQAIVPIRTKLPVSKATLFAVTVEKPGGVVVSDRSRLPLLAQL